MRMYITYHMNVIIYSTSLDGDTRVNVYLDVFLPREVRDQIGINPDPLTALVAAVTYDP